MRSSSASFKDCMSNAGLRRRGARIRSNPLIKSAVQRGRRTLSAHIAKCDHGVLIPVLEELVHIA